MRKFRKECSFVEAANTPTPGRKVVNIAYLWILRTGGMENPVISGKILRLEKRTDIPSRINLFKHTCATRSAKKQHLLHMDIRLQNTIGM